MAFPGLVLAALSDYLTLIIGGVIVVVSWIYSLGKKAMEEQEKRERQARQRARALAEATGGAEAEAPRTQSPRRAGGVLGMSPSTGQQPGNLTLEELRQRVQAKIAYEQRATALRQQQEKAATTPGRDPAAELTRRQRELARQRGEALRRQQAQARTAPQPQAARSRPATGRPSATPASAPGRMGLVSKALPSQLARSGAQETACDDVHRHVTDVHTAPRAQRTASVILAGGVTVLDARSLRDAFVLREIVDRPVALRQDAEF